MRAMHVVSAMLAATTGCATTWVATQVTGTARAWDEGVREEVVPLPGVEERLVVSLPLAIEYSTTSTTSTTSTASAPSAGVVKPFALDCRADQHARDAVYHSAFRYGKRWKTMTGLMFLAEAAAATAFWFGRADKPEYALYGGFFAVDAVGTAALFFVPRKEIYRMDERPVVTHVRSDCPDGLTLAIGDDRFPVDAAGRLGELGEAALDRWMAAPTGALELEVAGQVQALGLGAAELCTWQREHHRDQPTRCGPSASVGLRTVSATIPVPPGTLTRVAIDR